MADVEAGAEAPRGSRKGPTAVGGDADEVQAVSVNLSLIHISEPTRPY